MNTESVTTGAYFKTPVKINSRPKFQTPGNGINCGKGMDNIMDPVQVYCRLRPVQENEDPCITVTDTNILTIFTPEQVKAKETKHSTYSFESIFNITTGQKAIFEHIALPLVQDLLDGKSSLLFAYGVTGSGKTYTMSGTPSEPGIMPRVLDVLFNSIANHKAYKFAFKSDHMNGFEGQDRSSAMVDRQQALMGTPARTLRSATHGLGSRQLPASETESEEDDCGERAHDLTVLPIKEKDYVFSCFVTYIQIYNNNIYDLLDDSSYTTEATRKGITPQQKILREDASKRMYVHQATEIEVESAAEALEVFKRGQKRRKLAQTLLNVESSRSHSIFNVRLVQAPLNEDGDVVDDRNFIRVSQMSLVDLAGSERYGRTQAKGDRLKEAGAINNSLMQLRMCIEALRKKQKGQKVEENFNVHHYRNSKLTHYLKSSLEGEGRVRMILCLNPRSQDYDENLHACEFAELSKEINIPRAVVSTPRYDPAQFSNKRKGNRVYALRDTPNTKQEGNPMETPLIPGGIELGPVFPPLRAIQPSDGEYLKSLRRVLEGRIEKRTKAITFLLERRIEFRNSLAGLEREKESQTLKVKSLTEKLEGLENMVQQLQFECSEKDIRIDFLEQKNKELQQSLEQQRDVFLTENDSLRAEIEEMKIRHEAEIERITADNLLQRELDYVKVDRRVKRETARYKGMCKERDLQINAVKHLLVNAPQPIDDSSSAEDAPPTLPSLRRSGVSEVEVSEEIDSSCSSESIPLTTIKSPPGTALAGSKSPNKTIADIPRTDTLLGPATRSRAQSTEHTKWLEHAPGLVLKSATVFQPTMKNKKSVTKLTNVEDLAQKSNKYLLRTDRQDSEGEIETQLYKGDILPTMSGGAQIVFNDVEVLKQKSPTRTSPRKRPSTGFQMGGVGGDGQGVLSPQEITDRCATGIGHVNSSPKKCRSD